MSRRRSRRQARARERLLLRIRWMGGLLLLIGLCLAAWSWLTDPGNLQVRRIQVEQLARHLDPGLLRQAISGAIDGNFLTLDLERVRQAVIGLPWVASVEVKRVWPRTLVVSVKEHRPVAHWNRDGLVTADGEVFHPARQVDPPLPLRFHGPEERAPEVLRFYRQIAGAFADRGLRIREIRLNRLGEWRMRLAGGMTIVIGRKRKLFRINRLLRVHAVLTENERKVEYIDLRYDQGFAVRASGMARS